MKIYSIIKSIKDENYLSNSYRRLTRSKIIHFLLLLIDILLILFHEIDIVHRGFKPRDKTESKIIISPTILLIQKLENFPSFLHLLLILIPLLIFDFIFLLLCKIDIKKNNILLFIIINFMELFYCRLYVLFFFCLFFSLTNIYFIIGLIFLVFDIYIKIFNFLHNHLYFYVPKFVDYPYDEFSTRYDLYLLFTKLILSISGTATKEELSKFCFFVNFIIQIYYFYYFINKLFFHSYLFMKNSFLNKTKMSLFFGKITILILSYLSRDNNLFTIFYFVICIDIFLIFMGIFYFIYDPFSHIHLNKENTSKNILFFLNVINKRKDIEILIENQIIDHYKECRSCSFCLNYLKYRKEQLNFENENINDNEGENDALIINKDCKIIELFNILYDGNKKYFEFIVNLIINYKKYGTKNFNNNSNYFINLSNLIYMDYSKKDIVLALNEKLILEIINEENESFLENHHIQIRQIILYNEYLSLIKKILNLITEILNSVNNFAKIENLIYLSKLLKEMKNKKYKKYIFNRKYKNITNSRNILLSCSLIYEEILNKTIGQNRIPIRESNQLLAELKEDSKQTDDSNITLKFDLFTYNTHIIRTGKELSSYLNYNLYDLFPNIFKQHQTKLFIDLILNGFNDKIDEKDNKNKNYANKKKKNKNDNIEPKLIIYEKISNKTFYKLLNLKLKALFNDEINDFILFNGTYNISKNTIVSVVDLNHKKEKEEKVLGYSNLSVEKNLKNNLFSLLNYNTKRINSGHKLVKVFSYKILVNLYNIYNLETKKTVVMKRRSTIGDVAKFVKLVPKRNNEFIKQDSNDDEILKGIIKNKILEDIDTDIDTSKQMKKNKVNFFIDKKKTKNDDKIIYYKGLNKFQKIIIISITLILIITIFEYFIFYKNQSEEFNCNIAYRNFKEFFRLYNQLFVSILSVACIPEKIESKGCRNYISIFNADYSKNNPNENFSFSEYILAQNTILSQKIMEQKSNIMRIREYLGIKKYNKLFNVEMKYIQISKGNTFNINEITLSFFDAILIVCNSFRIITENLTLTQTEPIYFLNKSNNPFSNLYNQLEMTSYQEEIYKMVLNYKYFSKQIEATNKEIINSINKNISKIKFLVYFFLFFTTLLFLINSYFILCYIKIFNKIIIRILNDVIYIMNFKEEIEIIEVKEGKDGKEIEEKRKEFFDFNKTFTTKIEYLDSFLELYKVDPIKCVTNLIDLYKDYNRYLNVKQNYINNKEKNKGKIIIKKEKKKKEVNKIKIFQKIVSEKDIHRLKINQKYIYCFILIEILIIVLFFAFLIIWINFFFKKALLSDVIQKNFILEKSCYEAINLYHLMIFNNYTITEMENYMEFENINQQQNIDTNSNALFNSFYKNLYLYFDSQKDIKNLGDLYQSFEDLGDFNCTNLYSANKYELLEELSIILSNQDIKEKLINMCDGSGITKVRDIKTIFERHFQFIKNGMISLTDFSFDGINNNLNTNIIGRSTFFFLYNTIYIIEITISNPIKDSQNLLQNMIKYKFLLMGISFEIFGLALIFIIFFFYFYNINEFCKQIFLLKKTFNIYKIY